MILYFQKVRIFFDSVAQRLNGISRWGSALLLRSPKPADSEAKQPFVHSVNGKFLHISYFSRLFAQDKQTQDFELGDKRRKRVKNSLLQFYIGLVQKEKMQFRHGMYEFFSHEVPGSNRVSHVHLEEGSTTSALDSFPLRQPQNE